VFNQARHQGLKISFHCAETEEQAIEAQAMIDFVPDRLGHCCFLTKDQFEQIHKLGIPVEVCPTSNLAVVKEAHGVISMLPNIKQLLKLGSNFIVCCDDTMLFSTNISTELFEYATAFY